MTEHAARRKIVALDTSTAVQTIALFEDSRLVAETSSKAERNHALYLVSCMEALIAEQGWSKKDLDGIAVGIGPGSYTGVRISVTVAKTMSWALQVPVAPVSSLEAIAWGGLVQLAAGAVEDSGIHLTLPECVRERQPSTWFIPLVNGRRMQAFTAIYAAGALDAGSSTAELAWRQVEEDRISVIGQWVDAVLGALGKSAKGALEHISVPVSLPERVVFLGELTGFEDAIDQFARQWNGETIRMPYELSAKDIGALALRGRHLDAWDAAMTHELTPNYARLAEAEANLLRSQGKLH